MKKFKNQHHEPRPEIAGFDSLPAEQMEWWFNKAREQVKKSASIIQDELININTIKLQVKAAGSRARELKIENPWPAVQKEIGKILEFCGVEREKYDGLAGMKE